MIRLQFEHTFEHGLSATAISSEPVIERELIEHLGVIWRDVERPVGMPPRAFGPRGRIERRMEQGMIASELSEQGMRRREVRIDLERMALKPVAVFHRRSDRSALAARHPGDDQRRFPGLERGRRLARELLLGRAQQGEE